MLKNYIKIAFRNLAKRKVFTTIHILGLSVAFAAAIMLFLTAMYELSYDNFHSKIDRLGIVYEEAEPVSGKEQATSMPVPMGPALNDEIAAVEKTARVADNPTMLRYGDKQLSPTTRYVDPEFLSLFDFPLREGNTQTALADLDGIVLNESTARSLFGKEQALGKQIEVNQTGQWQGKIVTAILADIPNNSSIRAEALIRFEHFAPYADTKDSWNQKTHHVYVLLKENVSAAQFNAQVRPFAEKYFGENMKMLKRDGAKADKHGDYYSLHLLPLAGYHFSNLGGGVNSFYPWMLLLLSALILFIAGSNFVNLSLADSFSRSKEIGMRKTLGGQAWQLMAQLWGESVLICIGALLLGLLTAGILLPYYNAAMRYTLQIQELFNLKNLLIFSGIFILITVVAGGYPAWVMARFNTIETLKGKLKLGTANSLRTILTIVQFAIAVLLITGTIIISQQITYLQNRPLGYNKTEVISIPIGQDIDGEQALQRMRQELASLPEVLGVSGTDINMGRGQDGSSSSSRLGFEFEGKEIKTNLLRVDYDYLKTMDISLLDGRDFSTAFQTDQNAMLINEQMAKQLGKDAVGKELPVHLGAGGDSSARMTVIGVVNDFNFKSLHQEIAPLTMFINPQESPLQYIFVKVRPENLSAALQTVEQTWKKVNPKATAAASYLDENTNNEYRKEQRFASVITSAATLSVIISCMGLFALALLMMNRRIKEIGIRKVLGASVTGIVLLLSRDFVKMVIIGFAIATPIVWWAANSWLEDFAYHIDIALWMFLAGGILVMAIALLTVITQSMRTAMANPVDSLRDE